MRRSSFVKPLWIVLLGTFVAALPLAGVTLCLDGTAPHCCDATERAPETPPTDGPVVRGASCDCCITVDASPLERGRSMPRGLPGPAASAERLREVASTPPHRAASWVSGDGALLRRDPARGTTVLLI
jgi:hypothetical protein